MPNWQTLIVCYSWFLHVKSANRNKFVYLDLLSLVFMKVEVGFVAILMIKASKFTFFGLDNWH